MKFEAGPTVVGRKVTKYLHKEAAQRSTIEKQKDNDSPKLPKLFYQARISYTSNFFYILFVEI